MNQNTDFNSKGDLEQQLEQFRPAPIAPRLRQKIAGSIAANSRPNHRPLPAILTFAAIAASVAIVAGIWRLAIHHDLPAPASRIEAKSAVQSWPSLPTVGAFHQVICQSPQGIDPCLDFQNQLHPGKKTATEFRASDQSID